MTVFCVAGISVAISQWLILLKLWKLWGARKKVVYSSLIGYLMFQAGCIVFLVLTAHEALPTIRFSEMSSMCALTHRPAFLRGFYAWLLIFEVSAYSMVCYNALSRPRDSNQLLLEILYRDGILFFVATVTMRVLNLVMAVLDIPTQIFLGIYCIWGIITTIVSRMILGVREVEHGTEEWENESFVADKLEDDSESVMIIAPVPRGEHIRDSGTTFGGYQLEVDIYSGEMEFKPGRKSLSESSDMTAGTSPKTMSDTLRGSDGESSPRSKKWLGDVKDVRLL